MTQIEDRAGSRAAAQEAGTWRSGSPVSYWNGRRPMA